MTRARFLSLLEKAETLQDWEACKARFARQVASGEITGETGGLGYPDPEVYELVDALNAIDGICTVQSCSGHRVYPEGPAIGQKVMLDGETVGPSLWSGQVWLRTSWGMRDAFIAYAEELTSDPHIERASVLLGPAPNGDILDVIFQGMNAGETTEDGRRVLAETRAVLVAFFERLQAVVAGREVSYNQEVGDGTEDHLRR